jgi:hydrogenase maturation factor HypE
VADGATLQASATFISISDFVINGVVTIYGNLTVSEGSVTVGSGKSILVVGGDLFVGNELTNATGFINVLGKCTIYALLQTDAGSIIITNDLRTASNLENNGAGTIQIEGDCFVAGPFQNLAGGSISILKDLTVGSDVTNLGTLTLGPLTCNGNITNSGTITSNGGILYVGTYTNTGTVNNKMYKSP